MQETETMEARTRKEAPVQEFEKRETLDFMKERDIGIAFKAEFKRDMEKKDLERVREAGAALDRFIGKSKSMDEKVLLNVAEMIDRKDRSGAAKLFEKNQEMKKAVDRILAEREVCDFVVKSSYAEAKPLFNIRSVRDMVKSQITVKRDRGFNDLMDAMRKDEMLRGISENTDPVIMYFLARELVPKMMAGGVFGSAFKSLLMRMKGLFCSGIMSNAKSMVLMRKLSMALMLFGTPDGYVANEIVGGVRWKA